MNHASLLSLLAVLAAAGAAPAAAAAEPGTAPEPLTLAEAHAIALRNHPRVAIANLRELVAQEEVKQDRASYFPTAVGFADAVDAGNRDTRILAGGLSNSTIYDRVADGLSVNQLITDFGQTGNLVASAKLEARAEVKATAATDQQILLNVDANYYGLLQGQAVLRVAAQTVEARRLLVSQVTALARNQLKSELDVSFAEVAYEQAMLLVLQARRDASGAEAGLAAALGYPDVHRFQPADVELPRENPPGAETLVDVAMGNRPDLLRLGYERDAALRRARAARDQNYPTVAAVGEIGNAASHDYRLPNKYAVGAVTLNFPLFSGGAYLARQHEAEFQARIADESLRDARDNVSRDVRLALLNFSTSVQRLRTTDELLAHADKAYALAQARYKAGSSSIVELTDAQVNATSARIADANARYDVLIQRSLLDYQTGGLR